MKWRPPTLRVMIAGWEGAVSVDSEEPDSEESDSGEVDSGELDSLSLSMDVSVDISEREAEARIEAAPRARPGYLTTKRSKWRWT